MCYTNQLQSYFKLKQQTFVENQNKQDSLCEFLIQKHLVGERAWDTNSLYRNKIHLS